VLVSARVRMARQCQTKHAQSALATGSNWVLSLAGPIGLIP
jgi:hypothetical protein